VSQFNSIDLSAEPADAVQKRIIASSACKHTVSNKLDIIQEDEIEADEVVGEMLQTTNAKIKIVETPYKHGFGSRLIQCTTQSEKNLNRFILSTL